MKLDLMYTEQGNLSEAIKRSKRDLQSSVRAVMQNHSEFCERAAREIGTDPAIIAGYIALEHGPGPIKTGNSIKMLFMIRKHWTKKYRRKFGYSRPLPSWSNKRFTGSKKTWNEAYRLWPRGALRNASWGLAQVHAWSYRELGYSSEEEMVRDLKSSARAQEDSMINFIKTKRVLLKAIRNRDWWAMGRYYNGDKTGSYGSALRLMYNTIHPNNPDTQRIANSSSGHSAMVRKGQIATSATASVAATSAASSASGGSIALIGDSNAWRINQNYVKSNPNSVDMHQGAWAARHWLKTLRRFEQAKASGKSWRQYPKNKSGTWDYNYRVGQLLKQNPARIDVTMLGGNDAHESVIGSGNPGDKRLERHINEYVKPLMQIIKKYGGTYAGAAAAPKRLELRVKLNAALEKAAKEVGIPFYNPTKNIAYDMKNWGGSKDRVHLLGKQAEAEFLARKEFYSDKGSKSTYVLDKPKPKKPPLPKRVKIVALTSPAGVPNESVDKWASNAKELKKLFDSNGGDKVASYFVRWLEKGAFPRVKTDSYKGIKPEAASKIWKDVIAYLDTENVDSMTNPGVTLTVITRFLDIYNNGSSFKAWLKKLRDRLSEGKGHNAMKITQERLLKIIQEEVEIYKASQLNEVDVDELEDAEAYIKEIADLLKSTYETFFKGAAPAVGTPQTKADTGEPVTDQTAHEDAKGLLLDLLEKAIDKFQEKDSMHEDGHDDVPSAVRAMKTIAEDSLEMLQALEQMDGSLPTWWTNKMAVSASMLNKMRDYLLVPSMEEDLDEQ
tara:strand:+ start:74 stop:2419 length:2346 start_codon:yes stop_codon:yes gene_type:complete